MSISILTSTATLQYILKSTPKVATAQPQFEQNLYLRIIRGIYHQTLGIANSAVRNAAAPPYTHQRAHCVLCAYRERAARGASGSGLNE